MSDRLAAYREFLAAKIRIEENSGFALEPSDIHPALFPHQKAMVQWAVRGGRRAIFANFGLGKTLVQLETCRQVLNASWSDRALIVCPLGVRQEFKRDAQIVGLEPRFVRRTAEANAGGIYLTNYEAVREGNVDPREFNVVSLDEAAILRGLGGTKTFREFVKLFEGSEAFRFVATATPSPNDFIELLAYAAFLGIMDVGEAKTRFFKRNSEKADQLVLHPHKEREFWLWVASWALFVTKPSDLGFSDEGYDLPPLEVRWHEIPSGPRTDIVNHEGQVQLLGHQAIGVQNASREKRESLDERVAKLMEIRAEDPADHRLIWHDLEAERKAIEAAIPGVTSVYGSQDLDTREEAIIAFSDGNIRELASKPVLTGSGCNFQRFCHQAVFLGIGFKFADFIQSIHRIQRFGQKEPVRIDLIYTEAERPVRETLERKWRQHEELVANMTAIIREYGLSTAAMASALQRGMGCERREEIGERWRAVNNDAVEETMRMGSDSVDLILTSIPFATQYEYTPSYNDFGHTDDNAHFFEQMDYLTPELFRILRPGRVAAIHVKDRITPGGINGFGFQTVEPFHAQTIEHFRNHGFAYLGMKTIVTDVVRENSQTYRLGWTEQCKDGSRMGCGMPEYLLIFRKPPTDRSNGYADDPVIKSKGEYSRARWQFDAHGFMRSNGDRPVTADDFVGLKHDEIFRLFKAHSQVDTYDFEADVAIAEKVEAMGMLPPSFMLLQPQSWHDDVWTDVTRMLTLNGAQHAKGKEQHLCPLQFDICDRAITQYTMEGETVFDPFAGLFTVPNRAVRLNRIGIGVELSPLYWADGVYHLHRIEAKLETPSLFDLTDLDGMEDAN